jgi:hypothetical protein
VAGDTDARVAKWVHEAFALAQDAVHDCLLLRAEIERMGGAR